MDGACWIDSFRSGSMAPILSQPNDCYAPVGSRQRLPAPGPEPLAALSGHRPEIDSYEWSLVEFTSSSSADASIGNLNSRQRFWHFSKEVREHRHGCNLGP